LPGVVLGRPGRLPSGRPTAAFDLLRLSGTDTTLWPYRRRAALESLFVARRLSAPWALCPSTTDPATVREWLTWAAVGMEGVVYKRLDSRYEPSMRGWRSTSA
jgi:ATP-dependent DNA ligase